MASPGRRWHDGGVTVPADLADRVRAALESADLTAIGDLLSPDVRWGPPGDPHPPCRNRRQVLEWYSRGREAGTRARVLEVGVRGDALLVGMMVTRRPDQPAEGSERWQVLRVADGLITDIRGFEDRESAEAQAAAA